MSFPPTQTHESLTVINILNSDQEYGQQNQLEWEIHDLIVQIKDRNTSLEERNPKNRHETLKILRISYLVPLFWANNVIIINLLHCRWTKRNKRAAQANMHTHQALTHVQGWKQSQFKTAEGDKSIHRLIYWSISRFYVSENFSRKGPKVFQIQEGPL